MYYNHNSFIRSLSVQKRVIQALFLREIITRYGRNNIGFLWLFLEPLLITLGILTLWKIAKADSMYGLPIISFMMTGYPLAIMWRNSANRCLNAISANTGLLFHRNVRILDIFTARVFLEISGSTIAFILMFLCLLILGWVKMPSNILLMVLAWFLMAWFSLSLGFVIGVLSEKYSIFSNIWRPVSFLLFPVSGAFFLIDALPQKAQHILLYIPMIHGTEMFRQGYFGSAIRTYESIVYLVLINIILLFFGLAFIRQYSQKLEPL